MKEQLTAMKLTGSSTNTSKNTPKYFLHFRGKYYAIDGVVVRENEEGFTSLEVVEVASKSVVEESKERNVYSK